MLKNWHRIQLEDFQEKRCFKECFSNIIFFSKWRELFLFENMRYLPQNAYWEVSFHQNGFPKTKFAKQKSLLKKWWLFLSTEIIFNEK